MVGLFEPVAAAWNVDKIPDDFSFGEITPDWERMIPFLTKAMDRVPRYVKLHHFKEIMKLSSFFPLI